MPRCIQQSDLLPPRFEHHSRGGDGYTCPTTETHITLSSSTPVPPPIICHLSSDTCHLPPIICHLSSATCPATCHLQPIIYHLSFTIYHLPPVMPPVACHLSCHLSCHLLPATCHATCHATCPASYLSASPAPSSLRWRYEPPSWPSLCQPRGWHPRITAASR